MSQRTVYNLLKDLGKGTIDDIFNLAKKRKLKNASHRCKIRDSLILLSRKGFVKKENDKWMIASKMS